MAQVIIRNLDDHVVQTLKTKAELHGKSLEQELRDILTGAARLTTEEKLALVDRFHAAAPKPQKSDSAQLIREDRDNR